MYFEKAGPSNTEATAELALKVARERGIKNIVVSSNTGASVRPLLGNDDVNIVCVTHAYGARADGENEMTDEVRKEFVEKGVKLVTASHVLSGVERGISTLSQGMYPAEIMSHTLRMFGQGTKVCVEISVMALDAGQIPFGEKVIAIGGTGGGTDTAVIITPAHASRVFKTSIHEVICKPSLG